MHSPTLALRRGSAKSCSLDIDALLGAAEHVERIGDVQHGRGAGGTEGQCLEQTAVKLPAKQQQQQQASGGESRGSADSTTLLAAPGSKPVEPAATAMVERQDTMDMDDAMDEDLDLGEDDDDFQDDDEDEPKRGGARKGTGRASPQKPKEKRKVGRPIAYTGDPNAPELTQQEKRRIKRRIANRESARRVRSRRQGQLEEMTDKVTGLEEANRKMAEHVAKCDAERELLLTQGAEMEEKLRATVADSQRLKAELAQLRASMQGKPRDVLMGGHQSHGGSEHSTQAPSMARAAPPAPAPQGGPKGAGRGPADFRHSSGLGARPALDIRSARSAELHRPIPSGPALQGSAFSPVGTLQRSAFANQPLSSSGSQSSAFAAVAGHSGFSPNSQPLAPAQAPQGQASFKSGALATHQHSLHLGSLTLPDFLRYGSGLLDIPRLSSGADLLPQIEPLSLNTK